jgi:predicted DCC family thiol-disulfide oxidoreductase YuxK
MDRANQSGWVLYDGACGFCSRWIPFWAPVLRRRGLEIAPLQSSWVAQRLPLTEEELLEDIRILLADGTVLEGADAYREMIRRIWWAFPLYVLSVMPGTKGVFDAGYRGFARHRYRFSTACGMRSAPS